MSNKMISEKITENISKINILEDVILRLLMEKYNTIRLVIFKHKEF